MTARTGMNVVPESNTGDVISRSASRRTVNWRDQITRFSLLGVLILEYLIFVAIKPASFLNHNTILTIISANTPLLVASLGLTLTLVVAEFDLSVGAVLVFADVMVASLTGLHHLPLGAAVAVSLLAAVVIGAANAAFVVGLGLNSFVTTLAMASLLTGLGNKLAGSTILANIPQGLTTFAVHPVFWQIPIDVLYAAALALLMWYVYEFTPLGRYLYFIGANDDVARLAGIRVTALRALAFVASAAIVGFAGLLQAGSLGSADPSAAPSFLLPAFAAAFLGATAVHVGRYNVWGTVIASYLLITGVTGLSVLGLSGWVQDAFNGAALLVAITASRLARRKRV